MSMTSARHPATVRALPGLRGLAVPAAVCAILLLAGCSRQAEPAEPGSASAASAPGTGSGDAAPAGGTASAGTIAITAATLRPPPGGRDVTAAYLVVTSTGGADRLIGARSPEAASIELHTHTHAGGMMRMEEVNAVDIPAGATVAFEPGGLHLMLFGVTAAASGAGPVPVTLRFETAGEITVPFAVRQP